jgi:hypothetical protein
MDLTFGVCSAHALLVIWMAIDESGSGIPICFMLFTVCESARAAHADYDTAIFDCLLQLFKKGMGTNEHGEQFIIKIGNTDNDACERAALANNWGDIFLLLCIFHVVIRFNVGNLYYVYKPGYNLGLTECALGR